MRNAAYVVLVFSFYKENRKRKSNGEILFRDPHPSRNFARIDDLALSIQASVTVQICTVFVSRNSEQYQKADDHDHDDE